MGFHSGNSRWVIRQCPTYICPSGARKREASGSQSSLPIQTMNNILTASNRYTHFNPPISNQTDRKPEWEKDAKCCAVIPLMALRASERYLESEKRWQQHSFSALLRWSVCKRDKEISSVSSLFASSLTAQIQSLWLNADHSVCPCTWHAPLLGCPTMVCHPIIQEQKKEQTMGEL